MTVVAAPPRKSLEPFLRDDVTYFAHQVNGIRWLALQNSFILADDMGLGKSIQALTVFCIALKMGTAENCIIVCPLTLRENWVMEIEKFTRVPFTRLGEEPDPNRRGEFQRMNSTEKRNEQLQEWYSSTGPRILITHYEQIASPAHAEFFKSHIFDVAIFDEAHYIKNPQSKRSKASLALRSKRSFMLTGTPMLNQVSELWALLHRVNPTQWPKYWNFVNRYCVYGGWQNRQIVGVKNEKDLKVALGTVMLRRRKSEAIDLPEIQYIKHYVPLTRHQRELYDEVAEELLLPSPTGQGSLSVDNALVKFLRLKQICGSPYAIDPAYKDSSFKLDRVIEIVSELFEMGEKVVLFTQFRGVQDALRNRLKDTGLTPVMELNGSVPASERLGVVKEWSSVSGPAVLSCMYQVSGEGLNLVAARTGITVDKLFVPGKQDQAVNRLHRIGQSSTQPVQIHEIIAKGTIEHRVEQILAMKRTLFGEIVEGSVGMRRLMEALKEQLEDDMS